VLIKRTEGSARRGSLAAAFGQQSQGLDRRAFLRQSGLVAGGLATLVDRKSRYTIIVKIRCKEADHVHQKIKERLKQLDEERRRSLTLDNGTEFARCGRLEKHLDMQLYLADPGCPYQRGTNENTNGLIRQYYPKGTDFRDVSHQDVRRVEKLINTRPRACLGFKTPYEVFFGDDQTPDCD